jgi:hypothetical protein
VNSELLLDIATQQSEAIAGALASTQGTVTARQATGRSNRMAMAIHSFPNQLWACRSVP